MRLWIFLLLLILYILSPYDLIPDFLVGPGWVDDLGLIGALVYYYFYRQRKGHQSAPREESKERTGTVPEPDASPPPSPHEVLGVDPQATPEEIRAAYRRLANQYHPDKVSHLGEEFRVLAEQKFKEIQEAYQKLTGN